MAYLVEVVDRSFRNTSAIVSKEMQCNAITTHATILLYMRKNSCLWISRQSLQIVQSESMIVFCFTIRCDSYFVRFFCVSCVNFRFSSLSVLQTTGTTPSDSSSSDVVNRHENKQTNKQLYFRLCSFGITTKDNRYHRFYTILSSNIHSPQCSPLLNPLLSWRTVPPSVAGMYRTEKSEENK